MITLAGCIRPPIRSIHNINGLFLPSRSYREPSLANRWLASLVNNNGKDKIELIDLRGRARIPIAAINRADSQPISVAISANGNVIVFIRQRDDQTELFIYRRLVGTVQKIDLTPKGIPRRVALNFDGKVLAVQVSREGRWDIDIIRLKI